MVIMFCFSFVFVSFFHRYIENIVWQQRRFLVVFMLYLFLYRYLMPTNGNFPWLHEMEKPLMQAYFKQFYRFPCYVAIIQFFLNMTYLNHSVQQKQILLKRLWKSHSVRPSTGRWYMCKIYSKFYSVTLVIWEAGVYCDVCHSHAFRLRQVLHVSRAHSTVPDSALERAQRETIRAMHVVHYYVLFLLQSTGSGIDTYTHSHAIPLRGTQRFSTVTEM